MSGLAVAGVRPDRSAENPGVAFFCATFLKPEMLHVYRHITGLRKFRPVVLAQKCEGDWEVDGLRVIPRSRWRFLARTGEKLSQYPWQISGEESERILEVLDQEGCQLLHIFFGNVAVHLLPLLRRCPVPVVLSFHGSDVAGSMSSPGYAKAVKEMFELAAAVPCRSEQLLRQVAGMGCPPEKLSVMRSILPNRPLTTRTSPADDVWRIVQAARLVPKKGIATALRAFAIFGKTFPWSTFTVAGEGPLEEDLRDLARELRIDDRVEFTGFLSQEDLHGLLSVSQIFLHPSETVNGDTEGVPNAMLEAMALGLPVVATRHGGIPEVVTEGENGILADEKDVPGLSEALLLLAKDSNMYRRLSRQASQTVRDHFSAASQVLVVENLYREAILAHGAD